MRHSFTMAPSPRGFRWVFTAAVLAACLSAVAGETNFVKTTHTYKSVGDLRIQADVHRADDDTVRPVLVWIHGGALVMGSRDGVPGDLRELCRTEGYILISLDYRLAPEVKIAAIIEDLRDAFRWIREEGPKKFGADPERIVVAGGSAGGYLTMMAGIAVEPRPAALVAYWGYGDVDGEWYTKPSPHYASLPLVPEKEARDAVGGEVVTGTSPANRRARGRYYLYLRQSGLWTREVTGLDPEKDSKELDRFCPVRNITSRYPPILMVHGTGDRDVPCEKSADMARELARHGVRHELVTVEGGGHGLGGADRRVVDDARARARAFVKAHLQKKPNEEKAAKPPARPNILFLMADQLRGDCVAADGNEVIHTPNLDRLAREGARFRCAYSCTPSCTPARAAVLTGLGPWRNGMLGYGKVAVRYKNELPRMLRKAGYYTFGIGKMHFHPQRNRHGYHGIVLDESGRVQSPDFESDYRRWFRKQTPEQGPDATGIGWNDYRDGVYALPEKLHPTRWTADRAVEFLGEYDRPRPFLLKVSFARPHSPYDPPERFWQMYRDADVPAAAVGAWAKRNDVAVDRKNYSLWRGKLGAGQVRRSRRAYYGSVSFIDEQLGRILEALEKKQLLEKTLIVFTSDHGDMLGDHHLWRKTYAYEGSARIPMLVRWPASLNVKAARGQVLSQPVELRDILPTFLDAAGATFDEDALDGRSLLKLIRGQTEGWRSFIDLEHSRCYGRENHWNALTDGRIKYIFSAFTGEEQLFDLLEDPRELHDLASDPQRGDTLRRWRQRLVDHLSGRGEGFVKDGRLVAPRKNVLYSPNYPRSRDR